MTQRKKTAHAVAVMSFIRDLADEPCDFISPELRSEYLDRQPRPRRRSACMSIPEDACIYCRAVLLLKGLS